MRGGLGVADEFLNAAATLVSSEPAIHETRVTRSTAATAQSRCETGGSTRSWGFVEGYLQAYQESDDET